MHGKLFPEKASLKGSDVEEMCGNSAEEQQSASKVEGIVQDELSQRLATSLWDGVKNKRFSKRQMLRLMQRLGYWAAKKWPCGLAEVEHFSRASSHGRLNAFNCMGGGGAWGWGPVCRCQHAALVGQDRNWTVDKTDLQSLELHLCSLVFKVWSNV